ncbi:ATP-dependent DNA ligase [Zhihengliuella alba]|uniref:DNA ligase (ATP) n=1 Tax=Zhihengliuella alba TaxID=547018 RepID=A0ABP7DWM3_9MICC
MAGRSGSQRQTVEVAGQRLRVSNLDKVLYPEAGTTKADVLDYLARVAHVLVPQAAWRPVTRKRWVDGVGTEDKPGKVFFRKDLEDSAPDWIPRAAIKHKDHTNTYPLANDPAVLAWFGQVAALEVHVPQWRFAPDGTPRNPDRMVLDLDPGEGAGLAECAEVALLCRELLDGMDLTAVPVTSGSKGIHLYVALDGTYTTEQVSDVAHELARALEADHPDLVVSDMKKTLRTGKVLVDWSQNNGNKTTVCPYSLRGRARPMVAAPRTWKEIKSPDLAQLDYLDVLERVESGLDPIAEQGWHGTSETEGPGPRAGRKAAEQPSSAGDGPSESKESKKSKKSGGNGAAGRTGKKGDDGAAPAPADRLAEYRAKRDATKTREPVPEESPAPREGEEPIFVIQEHHARRLHYDFRLEHSGVLVSWAVPKGPPLETDENRLAVQTEDHPMEYATFEGEIAKGEYGAGQVSIWDSGTIEIEKWREGKEVIAVLSGRPDGGLGGVPRRFALINAPGMGGEDNWLLKLMKDQSRSPRDRAARREAQRSSAPKKPRQGDARWTEELEEPPAPMLATAGGVGDLAPDDDWVFEMKWDGVRAIVGIVDGKAQLTSRNGRDMSALYPELQELAGLGADGADLHGAVLDGEIVALGAGHRPDFGLLQTRMKLTRKKEIEAAAEKVPVHLMLFDALRVPDDGGVRALMREPYTERREALLAAVEEGEHIHQPPAHGTSRDDADGRSGVDDAIESSLELGLEGIIAKRADSTYQPGRRSRNWIKIKNEKHQEVVVIGWRTGLGSRAGSIGSLLVAVPEDGGLVYAGRVGTGFDDRDLEEAAQKLRRIERKTPPADVPRADARDAHWVTPRLVGEVRYSEVTGGGRLRHPVWRGWRPDKDADDVGWEE